MKKNSKYCHICKTRFNYDKDNEHYESYRKVRDHDHYTGKYRRAAHSKCNLEYQIPKEIPVVFHNGSKYDYHFIINELTKDIDGIKCLDEDTEKYISFSVPLSKDGESFTYKLKFIDSFRFMNRSLANLRDNLSELDEQTCDKCKKKCKYITRKNDTSIYKCNRCNDTSYKSLAPLKEKFANTYQFFNIRMNTWIAGKDLMKQSYHPKKNFTAN